MKDLHKITKHTVVLVVGKQERGAAMSVVLTKIGYRVVTAISLYDALKTIAQELPHLVITEALLQDGTAGTLYDRLKGHPVLQHTPILVNVLNKTKQELAPLANKKFSGFFLGRPEPKQFAIKVREVITAKPSPYFLAAEDHDVPKDISLSIEAAIVGLSGDHVMIRSKTEVDPKATLLCVPENKSLGPALFKMATNQKEGEEYFNLFPINRILGKGRKWIEELPKLSENTNKKSLRKVLFFDPDENRFGEFNEVLEGYDYELVHAKTLDGAASALRMEDDLGCVYLDELIQDRAGIEWKNAYGKLGDEKPPVIVGTRSSTLRSTNQFQYLKKPFGLGVLLEILAASFEKSKDLAKDIGYDSGHTGVPARLQAPAKLIGLDESGGILQIRFPVLVGSWFNIAHPVIESLLGDKKSVKVVACTSTEGEPDKWYLRFQVGFGGSKAKYWEKLVATIDKAKSAEKESA